MVLNNFVVELSKHVPVVVDQLEELARDGPKVILADGEARRNL